MLLPAASPNLVNAVWRSTYGTNAATPDFLQRDLMLPLREVIVKRVASAVGEGAVAVSQVYRVLAEL